MKQIRILLLASMLFACVPTPHEEFIVNKGEQKNMLDLARVEIESVETEQIEANRIDYGTLFGIPSHLAFDETGADGRIHLIVDADVIAPEAPLPAAHGKMRIPCATFSTPWTEA